MINPMIEELKRTGLYIEWAAKTDIAKSEHDKWLKVMIDVVHRFDEINKPTPAAVSLEERK